SKADVVLAQGVGERLEQAVAEVTDELRDRIAGEDVADERQLDAEDLAVHRVLQRTEQAVEAIDSIGRVAQEFEQESAHIGWQREEAGEVRLRGNVELRPK